MADDGPRNGGSVMSYDVVALREYLMALIHALDVRVTSLQDARTKLADERFATERSQTREQFDAVEKLGNDRMTYLLSLAEERRQSNQRAVDKVEIANEKRFENMNEFRAQLRDQAAHFITRNEMDAKITGWSERVDRSEHQTDGRLKILEAGRNNLDGRFWALGVGVGVIVFLINFAMRLFGMK